MPTQWNRPKMTYADVVKEPKTQQISQGQRITTYQMNQNRPDRRRRTLRKISVRFIRNLSSGYDIGY